MLCIQNLRVVELPASVREDIAPLRLMDPQLPEQPRDSRGIILALVRWLQPRINHPIEEGLSNRLDAFAIDVGAVLESTQGVDPTLHVPLDLDLAKSRLRSSPFGRLGRGTLRDRLVDEFHRGELRVVLRRGSDVLVLRLGVADLAQVGLDLLVLRLDGDLERHREQGRP